MNLWTFFFFMKNLSRIFAQDKNRITNIFSFHNAQYEKYKYKNADQHKTHVRDCMTNK